MVHCISSFDRGRLVDMDEGALAFARGVGDSGEAFLDQFAGGGASVGEVGSEQRKCRSVVFHFQFSPSWPGIAVRRTASLPLDYVPAIHVLLYLYVTRTWMPGTSPGTTTMD